MVDTRGSLMRARSTYSPAFVNVAVATACPLSAALTGGSNLTPAGPRQTIQVTLGFPVMRGRGGRWTCGTFTGADGVG